MVEETTNNLPQDFMSPEQMMFNKQPEDFKAIVIKAIEKCRLEGSKEMVKGGEIKTIINGVPIVTTIPNQRKVFINCVMSLYDLLLFYFDDIANSNIQPLFEKINGLPNKHLEIYLERETNEDLKEYSERTKYISPQAFLYEETLENIEEERLILFREIYRELILLFKRKNDLSNKRTINYS